MRRLLIAVVGCALYLGTAHANSVTFFGEDLGQGENIRLAAHPNADAARASFLAQLIGVGTENFEGFLAGTGAPLALTFGAAGNATLTDPSFLSSIQNVPVGTNGFGRYPISGNQFWETGSNMVITFTQAVAAFGFYGVDIGDFNGQVILNLANGGAEVLNIGNTVNGLGGAVLYFGAINAADPFTSVTFTNTNAGTDFFGFDDMTIGSVQQVQPCSPNCNPVPEPSTLLTLVIGLLGLGGFARRRLSL